MPTVLIEKHDDGVALITLNRPDSLNAMGEDLLPRLAEALEDCEQDRAVRCVALTGAGRGFCAGGDVKGMASRAGGEGGGAPPPGVAARSTHKSQLDTTWKLHTMSKPTVALVNGPAAGGGLGLALGCDFRVASEKATFVTAFRNVGLSGDYGGTWLMQKMVGIAVTRDLFLRGGRLNAEEALALRLVNKVVPHEDLMTEGLAFCQELAQGPTAALAMMKWNINFGATSTLWDLLYQEGAHLNLAFQGEDHKEAARAFVEKRPPKFTGR